MLSGPPHGSAASAAVLRRATKRLAWLVTDGDQAACAELYEHYQQPLLRVFPCRSILGGEADSQDAVQSAFVRALAALQRDSRNAPVRPWLYRIAHNEAMSVLRRRGARARLREQLEHQSPVIAHWSADHDRLELLIEDLWELPEQPAPRALCMRELSGLSHQEIAAGLGTSVSSAKQAVFEARRALTEFAEGREAHCAEIRAAIGAEDPRTLRSRRIRAHLRGCAACAALGRDRRPKREAARRAGAGAVAVRPQASASSHPARDRAARCGRWRGAIPQAAGALGGSAGMALAVKAITVVALVRATAAGGVAVTSPRHRVFLGRYGARLTPAGCLAIGVHDLAAGEHAVSRLRARWRLRAAQVGTSAKGASSVPQPLGPVGILSARGRSRLVPESSR